MTATVEEKAPSDAPVDLPPAPEKSSRRTPEPKRHSDDDYATFDELLDKPTRERDLVIQVGAKKRKIHLIAIGGDEYDRLIDQCPPTPEQRDNGALYNPKKFAPMLISRVVSRPRMDLDQATRLYNDPAWSGGETGGLFRGCVEICQAGLDVPFTDGG